jgi:hypothetical protein
MSEDVVEKIFGEEFLQRYKVALAKAREIPKEKLEEIRKFTLTAIRDNPEFRVEYDNLDVIVAQAPLDTPASLSRRRNQAILKSPYFGLGVSLSAAPSSQSS